MSTDTTAAINAAQRVASLRGADDKLDALAKAIEALAKAVASLLADHADRHLLIHHSATEIAEERAREVVHLRLILTEIATGNL